MQIFGKSAMELNPLMKLGADGIQITVLEPGTYKIECWGWQGGNNSNLGGYVVGELELLVSTTLNIYVGGKGTNGGYANGTYAGGWNGGGYGRYASGGGGSSFYGTLSNA